MYINIQFINSLLTKPRIEIKLQIEILVSSIFLIIGVKNGPINAQFANYFDYNLIT